MKLRHYLLGRKAMTNLDSILKSRDIILPSKVHLVIAMFFHIHVWMWELDYKESWALMNWCFWTVVLEKILENQIGRASCRERVETVMDFVFWGSKITADGDCRHEIKQCLLLERNVMTNLDSILKSRDVTLPTKVHIVKAMVFPVVMYECESWTIKKAEYKRTDAFELWCWRRLLRVAWTARSSKQS